MLLSLQAKIEPTLLHHGECRHTSGPRCRRLAAEGEGESTTIPDPSSPAGGVRDDDVGGGGGGDSFIGGHSCLGNLGNLCQSTTQIVAAARRQQEEEGRCG
jgi:hypothetical protein